MRTHQWLLNTLTAAILVGLGACGGGGNDPGETDVMIGITASNRDTVAHATAAGAMGLSPTALIPITSGSAGVAWRQAFSVRVDKLSAQREHPLVVIPIIVDGPCQQSGSFSMSIDDRDNSGTANIGDVLTIVFKNCSDEPGATVDGTSHTTLTGFTQVPFSFTGRMTMSQMSAATASHSATVNGDMLIEYSEVPTTSNERTKITAAGPVTVAVSTHLPFTDTVTMQDGFVVDDTHDGVLERTVSTFTGSLKSAAAGGLVDVTTVGDSPITKYDADVYPRAGTLQVKGKTGTLKMTALSTDQVRLTLDENDDGLAESTETVAWDWLL
jgi:hypothetical protein